MTSSMQARQSLSNLSELFTDMLGNDATVIGAAAPDAPSGDKLAEEIKTVIREESAKTRLASMTVAGCAPTQMHASPPFHVLRVDFYQIQTFTGLFDPHMIRGTADLQYCKKVLK